MIFIKAFLTNSNSSIILENMDGIKYVPVVSYRIIEEVQKRSKELYGKDVSGLLRLNILMPLYSSSVTDIDDLPHICAYFAANCNYFVTANRRLTQMKIKDIVNFKSPKAFVKEVLGLKPLDTVNNV